MSMSSQEREFEESIARNEGDQAVLAELHTKADIKDMEQRLGRGEVKQLIRDGAIKVAKSTISSLKSISVNKETSKTLYGDFSGLKAYNDPANMRRPR